jgi:hypothetical protein
MNQFIRTHALSECVIVRRLVAREPGLRCTSFMSDVPKGERQLAHETRTAFHGSRPHCFN